jgi:hypothetical protein
MNPTTSLSNAPVTNEACVAREAHQTHTRRGLRHRRGLLTAAALCALCVSMAGCGDGSSSTSNRASGSTTAANNAAAGAGGASAPVPIVAAPASGACAALGASAAQPLQNTQLVCAP